jgi:hypothetical protein
MLHLQTVSGKKYKNMYKNKPKEYKKMNSIISIPAFDHDQRDQGHHLALPTSNQSILKQDLQTLPHQKLSFRGNLKNDEKK